MRTHASSRITPPVWLELLPCVGATRPQRRQSQNSPRPDRAPRTAGQATRLPRGAHPYPYRAAHSSRFSPASIPGSSSAVRSAPGSRARSSRRRRPQRGSDGRRGQLYGASPGAAWPRPGSGARLRGQGSAARAPGWCPGSGSRACCGDSRQRTPKILLAETSSQYLTVEAAHSSGPEYMADAAWYQDVSRRLQPPGNVATRLQQPRSSSMEDCRHAARTD